MMDQTTQLTLRINAELEADVEELANLTQRLRTELLDLDVESVNLIQEGEIPSGAKTGDPVTWGTLLVTLASTGVLTTLINVLQSWLKRNEQRSIILEVNGDKLEVKGVSTREQQRLVNEWLGRHRGFVIANG